MNVAVGVDMGGTRIKLGLIHDGKIVAQESLATSSHISLASILTEAGNKVDALLAKNNATPTGIGIAFPGVVDNLREKVLSKYVKYPDAQDFDFAQWANRRWNIPVALENEAKAALIGEWQFGNGKGSNDLVLITLGSGVGTAVMMGGKLLPGRNFVGGNRCSHMMFNMHGKHGNCDKGLRWALADDVKNAPQFFRSSLSKAHEIDFKNLFKHADREDSLAVRIRDKCLMAWSLLIINLIHAFGPARVMIGGGIMESQQDILPHIQRTIVTRSWATSKPPDLLSAAHPQTAGILGMYYLLNQR